MTDYIEKALKNSGFPSLDKYYLLEMENNAMVVVLQFKEGFQWGVLVDSSKVNLGLLLSIAVPNARKALIEAIHE